MPREAAVKYGQYREARGTSLAAGGLSSVQVMEAKMAVQSDVKSKYIPLGDRGKALLSVLKETGADALSGSDAGYGVGGGPGPLVWVGLVILLLLPGCLFLVLQGLMPFGLTKLDPKVLRVGRKTYDLESRSGQVIDYDQARSVKTHISSTTQYHGSSSIPTTSVSSFNTTHIHQDFWLRSPTGFEARIQLEDWDANVRRGHMVSALAAVPSKSDRGPIIYVLNHTTGEPFLHEAEVKKMLRVGRWFTWTIAPALLPFFYIKDGTAMITAMAILVVLSQAGWSYRWVVTRRRIAQFRTQVKKRLVPILRAEVEGTPAPSRVKDVAKELATSFLRRPS